MAGVEETASAQVPAIAGTAEDASDSGGTPGCDSASHPEGVPSPGGPPSPEDPQRPGSVQRRDSAQGNALDLLGDPSQTEVRFRNRPESAGMARRLAAAVLHGQWRLPGSVTDDGVLLVSELVGNAVRHTGAHDFGLRMFRRRGWIRVEVRDPSRGLPCLLPMRELDTTGRGLWLVDRLADRWGVDLLPRGKTTWFEIRVLDR
ncbi:ATP-binding protein [Streptomyces sp. JJ66]|uniref:ATP-binding protein n=1 Tax=Streptomyces sp. JJ66 TaxID=2803843 RepID=UPI001C569197|nr:ATP-binding protein [Streptomyces sp. JJ66]MBW1601536.1 ATP-binding protein [Streptomyces sp. JJ66]